MQPVPCHGGQVQQHEPAPQSVYCMYAAKSVASPPLPHVPPPSLPLDRIPALRQADAPPVNIADDSKPMRPAVSAASDIASVDVQVSIKRDPYVYDKECECKARQHGLRTSSLFQGEPAKWWRMEGGWSGGGP